MSARLVDQKTLGWTVVVLSDLFLAKFRIRTMLSEKSCSLRREGRPVVLKLWTSTVGLAPNIGISLFAQRNQYWA